MAPTTSSTAAFDLITLGETMLRLSPPGRNRLDNLTSLDVHVGGAESNVASALARLGKSTAWWSSLPNNTLGRQVASTLRMHGVDTASIAWREGRLGTYFVEFGSAPRATTVIYDRANSAASQMTLDDFDWSLLAQTRWLHLTGITPALSQNCLETVRHALQQVKQNGIQRSFDLNYRAKLWSPEDAAPVLSELAAQCSLVIAADRDIKTLFGLEGDSVAQQLFERWQPELLIITQGERGAIAYDGRQIVHAPALQVAEPIRIGAGDAFDAGLLYALMENKTPHEALIYGNTLAALKMTMPGDIALVTRAELEQLVHNPPSQVQR